MEGIYVFPPQTIRIYILLAYPYMQQFSVHQVKSVNRGRRVSGGVEKGEVDEVVHGVRLGVGSTP